MYIVFIIGENQIDTIFNQICMDSIVNSTKSQICPSFLIKNSFFNWKNEILNRKMLLITTKKPSLNLNRIQLNDVVDHNLKNMDHLNPLNQTSKLESKLSPIEDIYLLLLSVSMINFFISLIIPLVLIRSNRRSKKLIESSSFDENDSKQKFLTSDDSSNALDENDDENGGFIQEAVVNFFKHIKLISFFFHFSFKG